MRVILDTNVLISAIFFGGQPFKILDAWRKQKLTLIISPEILAEYIRVSETLHAKHSEIDLGALLALVATYSEICSSPKLPKQICSDPDDDKFIACAVASGTKTIVSGDKALLAVSDYEGISILTPRAFCVRYLP